MLALDESSGRSATPASPTLPIPGGAGLGLGPNAQIRAAPARAWVHAMHCLSRDIFAPIYNQPLLPECTRPDPSQHSQGPATDSNSVSG